MTSSTSRIISKNSLPAPAYYVLALALSFSTAGILKILSQYSHVNNTTVALIFILPVGISASLWGLMPGILAAISSFITFNFLFIPDLYTLQVKKTEDLIVLGAFLIIAVVISQLAGNIQKNLLISTEREQEAVRLYEYVNSLSASTDLVAIAKTILETVDHFVHPARIEILIENQGEPIFLARDFSSVTKLPTKPLVIPVQTSHYLAGEIRLWNETSLNNRQMRFLEILTNQAAMSIERTRLSEQAHKSRLLEESDKLKTSLLSSVSHELRSPLAAIKASVSSLRLGDITWDEESRIELLTTIEEEIDHLNILVGNLLDMSRIEAGALKPLMKPNMLNEIINAALDHLQAEVKNFHLQNNVSEDLPMVNVDFVQMQQVFYNLLSNSFKYSPEGSLISIDAETFQSRSIHISISNQSLPLPPEDIDRIFEKFYRINPSEKITGSGLGLSICKGIIEAHNGKIWAENRPGGLTFHFTIPMVSHDQSNTHTGN